MDGAWTCTHAIGKTDRVHLAARRQVLTGSYHNYFRIYDAHGTGEVVLQADKSAFKAKKIGGVAGKNGPKGSGFRKEGMNLETIDFNKKILHGSWHPRENTIAVCHLSFYRVCYITC